MAKYIDMEVEESIKESDLLMMAASTDQRPDARALFKEAFRALFMRAERSDLNDRK